MGIFSWLTSNLFKSNVAVLIQYPLEALAREGLLYSQPPTLANRMVEAGFNRIPHLGNLHCNKYVMAVTILAMVPALPSFSVNERESSKHALGMLLKHIRELQISNSLALTLSEQQLLDRAQMTFLNTTQPDPKINLGP